MEQRALHYNWAEAALGSTLFYDDARTIRAQTEPEFLPPETIEQRQLFYTMALRGLAKIRREERLSSLDPFNNDAWQPLPSQLEVLKTHHEPLARRLALLNNLEHHIALFTANPGHTNLRAHQKDSFETALDFLRTTTPETITCENDSIEKALTKGGYFDLPTAYGKMFMIVELAKAFGLGQPASEASPRRLRSLVLVPRKVLAKQVLKEFKTHAPHIEATNYAAQDPDGSGDVVVMTYQMFNNLTERDIMKHFEFDMVMCDEAHHGLGEVTRKNLEQFRRGKLAMGFTASSEYAEDHTVEQILPHLIQRTDVRTAIEAGILSGVQCVSYATGAEIVVERFGAQDFTIAELAQLAQNEARNLHAHKFTKAFVESGLQGIISCIPGGDCRHARNMADDINNAPPSEWITDPKTGEQRPIKAVAVGSFLSDQELDAALLDFEEGRIDVLTYVKIIGEGWDSDKAKFLISLSPTASPVRAIQRFGRVLRPGAVACVVEFIDRVVNGYKKKQHTFIHILGEEIILQDRIYGYGFDGGDDNGPVLEVKRLPLEMRERIAALEAVPINELIVLPRVIQAPPPNWIALPTLAEIAMGMSAQYIRKLLLENDFEDRIAKGKVNIPTYFFPPEAETFVKENMIFDRPHPTWINVTTMHKTLDISLSMATRILNDFHIEGRRCRGRSNMIGTYYTPEEFARVKAVIDALEVASPGEDNWDTMAAEWQVSKTILLRKCRDLGIQGTPKRVRPRGPIAGYYTPAQKKVLRIALDIKPLAPEGWRTIPSMAREAQVGRVVIELYLKEHKLWDAHKEFRGKTGSKVSAPAPHWPPNIVARIVEAVGVRIVPKGWQALYDYAQEKGLSNAVMKTAVSKLTLDTQKIRTAGRRELAFASPEEIARLNRHFGFKE